MAPADRLHAPSPPDERHIAEELLVDDEIGDRRIPIEDRERVVAVLAAHGAGPGGVHHGSGPRTEVEVVHRAEMIEMGVAEQQRHLSHARPPQLICRQPVRCQALRHQLIDARDLGALGAGIDDQDARRRADEVGVGIGDRRLVGKREDLSARCASDRSPHINHLPAAGQNTSPATLSRRSNTHKWRGSIRRTGTAAPAHGSAGGCMTTRDRHARNLVEAQDFTTRREAIDLPRFDPPPARACAVGGGWLELNASGTAW